MPIKVIIVGGKSDPAYITENHYDDSWEYWGLNAIRPKWAKHIQWARWFNIHRYAHLQRDWPKGLRKEITWANKNPRVPFYTVDSWRGKLPHEVLFPRDELEMLPRGTYHAGSFDWMVAFAVHLGAKRIALHGVGLGLDSPRDEPISARACLEYWCGYAEGVGCEIIVAPDCELFYQYHLVRSGSVYGYDDVQLVEDRR